MKNFAKFIPVALGLLTLASCSSDDLFGEKSIAEEAQAGDLFVEMEDLQEEGSVFTRSYIDATTNAATRKYVPLDELSVYDNDLHKYDIYAFTWVKESENIGVFRRKNTEPNITEAKWAIYPHKYVEGGQWKYNEITNLTYTEAQIRIPSVIDYDATYASTDTKFETPLYKDELPRWGAVSAIGDGDKLQTSLKYMTGVLRLKLAGIPKYAPAILVKMLVGGLESNQVTLNGVFTTKIAKNDNPDPNAQLAMVGSEPTWSLTDGIKINTPAPVDLLDQAKSHAVLYVPLVTTGETAVDIVIYAPSEAAMAAGVYRADQKADWKEIKRFKDKKIAKAKLYGNKSEVNLAVDGDDVNSINDALEMSEPDEETIVLEATNADGIEVCDGGNNTIKIPNKAGVKNIILDLSNGVYGCSVGRTLYIQDKDPGNRFTGNVMLIGAQKAGKPGIKLDVQLPSTEGFAYAGDGVGSGTDDDLFKIDSKSFTLGDGKTATTYSKVKFALSENVATLNVSENAKFTDGITVNPTTFKAVKAINVNNGAVTGAIDAATAANPVNITATGDKAEISGAITTKGTVTISSKKANFQDITADGAISISSEAVAQNVESVESTVSLSDKAIAVSIKAKGNISIDKEAKNVGGSGVVSSEGNIVIANEFTAAGAQAGPITATLGSVTLSEAGNFTVTYGGAITAGQDVVATGNVLFNNTITAGQDVKLSGKAVGNALITAGRDFLVSEEAVVNNVTLKHKATVNITTKDGDALAVAGALVFADGADYGLDLLSGVINTVTNNDGEVSMTFETPAAGKEAHFTAIGLVSTPDNLKPTNASVWNGKKLTVANAYWIDDTRIWTASQLGMLQGAAADGTTIDIRSDINLNEKDWIGINAVGTFTLTGNYKTISNLKITGHKASKTAGFLNFVGSTFNISNLTFDGVQSDVVAISGGEYDQGIGAIVGQAYSTVNMSRVIVKLAGGKFGSNGTDNVKTANVGGLIGLAKGVTTLIGTQVDATGAQLTGYKNLGGYIGSTTSNTNVRMAEKDGDDPRVDPVVTGLKFFITYDASEATAEVNDPYQGTNGWFIGAINLAFSQTFTDVANVMPAIVYADKNDGCKANEAVAFKISDTTHRYFFKRDAANADQTLIGNSGFVLPGEPGFPGTSGTFSINGAKYEVFKTDFPFIVGHPKLYSLINEAHVN